MSDLRPHPLFVDCSDRALRRAVRHGTLSFVAEGTILALQGAKPPGLGIVIEGDTEVSIDGHPFLVRHRRSHFGEISITGLARSCTATVTAASDCRILSFDRLDYEALAKAIPQLPPRLDATAETRVHEVSLQRNFMNELLPLGFEGGRVVSQ